MILQNIKDFLVRLSPKISFSPDVSNEISVSLGITPKEYSAEEILQLPELIAQKIGKRIVVCIDEFQQISFFLMLFYFVGRHSLCDAIVFGHLSDPLIVIL
mgnify:CR=1 FL=1